MVPGINTLLTNALNYGGRTRPDGITMPSLRSTYPSKNTPAAKGDSVILSEPLRALKELGVNLEGSTFSQSAQALDFKLQFTDEHIQNMTAGGSYDFHSQSLQVDFSFKSALIMKDPTTGEERQEFFQFDFHLEASRVEVSQTGQKEEKEDILQFARRIMGTISKLHSEGKEIDGLVLDSEDLKELGSVDNGKLLKSIMEIVDLLRSVDRLRGENRDHILLKPERGKTSTTEEQQREESSFSLSVSVTQLSSETQQSGNSETEST